MEPPPNGPRQPPSVSHPSIVASGGGGWGWGGCFADILLRDLWRNSLKGQFVTQGRRERREARTGPRGGGGGGSIVSLSMRGERCVFREGEKGGGVTLSPVAQRIPPHLQEEASPPLKSELYLRVTTVNDG